jgi:anthranilate synthase component 2
MREKQLLLIDNYDSFTFNLYHLFAQLPGVCLEVKRNDELKLAELDRFDGVIIGPGPGSPTDEQYFGKCMQVIVDYGTKGLPILGVCLGFQGIAHAFGTPLKRAPLPMHGKLSKLNIYKTDTILAGLANEIMVMRYHSLLIDGSEPFSDELVITAEVQQNEPSIEQNGREIMALEHKKHPIYGVQFHPESFASEGGFTIAQNFVQLIG